MDKWVLATFGLVCSILLTLGALSFFGLRAIDWQLQTQQSRAVTKLALIEDVAQDAGQMQAEVLLQVLAADAKEKARLCDSIRARADNIAKSLAGYERMVDGDAERQLCQRVTNARKAYWLETDHLLSMNMTNHAPQTAKWIVSTQAPLYDNYIEAINNLSEDLQTDAGQSALATADFISRLRVIDNVLVAAAICIAVGTGVAVLIVARRLREDNHRLQNEIAERKKAEQKISLQYSLSRAVAKSATVQQCERLVLEAIGQSVHYDLGLLWVVDHRSDALKCEQTWHGEDSRLAAFAAAMNQRTFSKGAGIPGRVWAAGQASFSGDISGAGCDCLKAAGEAGLGRAFAVPVLDGRGVTGVAEFFARPGGAGGDGVLEICGNLGVELGQAFEHKRVQEQLYQSQKMETVGKLAAGVAHEFNSIMTAIIGQSAMLFDDLPPGSSLQRNATEISKAAERATSLTRQLLAYGRKQILNPEVLDLNKVLAGMDTMLRHLMGKEADVLIVPGPGSAAIRADAGQIEQLIMNIAMNAADAMPNGGKLTLETSNILLEDDSAGRWPDVKPGAYVVLAVTDTGSGMTEEVKARAFDPFFTTKEPGKGTGLGLSTCQGIVKQSNGHISLYSEPGRGSTFKIFLPQAQSCPKAPVRSAGKTELPRGSETILMVEDDPALRNMAGTLLQRLGYRVLAAADGVDALKLACQGGVGHIDLLFTDVIMPHMSGKELSDRIRAAYPKTQTLFTSAYAENAIVHQGVLAPGVKLLQKPFTPAMLAGRIREVLDGR